MTWIFCDEDAPTVFLIDPAIAEKGLGASVSTEGFDARIATYPPTMTAIKIPAHMSDSANRNSGLLERMLERIFFIGYSKAHRFLPCEGEVAFAQQMTEG